ncbi:MAG: response regulator [Parafilimonas sp.]|nr:response regulator [Parafilimonas sp.]
MTKCYYVLGNFNFFSVFIPGILIDIIVFCVIIAAIVIFYSQRIKKLKHELSEAEAKKNELQELFANAEQLNKNLVQEHILDKENNEMLIAKMSYEIHNCVNGIIGMANVLKDTNLNAEQAKANAVIISRSKKLLESAHGSFNTEAEAANKLNETKTNSDKLEKAEITAAFCKKYPLSILVAEDDAINQQLAKKWLSKLGYTADIASNGKEALEMVSERNYDVILMDVLMPEMDGFEATKMIRLCLDIQPTIIAVTASAMSGDKDKCLEAGMDDYICKPIVIDELAQLFVKWSHEKKIVV